MIVRGSCYGIDEPHYSIHVHAWINHMYYCLGMYKSPPNAQLKRRIHISIKNKSYSRIRMITSYKFLIANIIIDNSLQNTFPFGASVHLLPVLLLRVSSLFSTFRLEIPPGICAD